MGGRARQLAALALGGATDGSTADVLQVTAVFRNRMVENAGCGPSPAFSAGRGPGAVPTDVPPVVEIIAPRS